MPRLYDFRHHHVAKIFDLFSHRGDFFNLICLNSITKNRYIMNVVWRKIHTWMLLAYVTHEYLKTSSVEFHIKQYDTI